MKKPPRVTPQAVQVETLKLLRQLAVPLQMLDCRSELVPLPVAGGIVHHRDYERAYWGHLLPMSKEDWQELHRAFGDPWDNGRPMTISDLYS